MLDINFHKKHMSLKSETGETFIFYDVVTAIQYDNKKIEIFITSGETIVFEADDVEQISKIIINKLSDYK